MMTFADDYIKPASFKMLSFANGKVLGRINESFPAAIVSNDNGVQVRGLAVHPSYALRADWINEDRCADLSPLAKLPFDSVRELRLDRCQFDDYQLKHILHFSYLQTLSLGESSVSEFGLFLIRGFTNLMTLILSKTATNDLGLSYLSGLQVRNLYLKKTDVTDAGLSTLRTMNPLLNISLPPKISGEGLEMLAGLAVEDLDLSGCLYLRNEELSCLAQLPRLSSLCLPAQIDDSGLDQLKVPKLKYIVLPPDSQTSPDGRQKLLSDGISERVNYPCSMA